MRKDERLSKEEKAKAKMLGTLLNEFLEKDLKEKDLSTPNKISNYWKILEKNLWQQEMEPPGPFCPLKSEHMDASTDITGLHKAEHIGSANTILWLHQFLKFRLDLFENPKKFYPADKRGYIDDEYRDDWFPYFHYLKNQDPRTPKKAIKNKRPSFLRNLDGETFDLDELRTEVKDPVSYPYGYIFGRDLKENMSFLERCKDNLCRKWFIRRPNKEFCCHKCAARYRKRMKVGKGDLQLSYRPRRPNKKKT